jgi:hypothetical protein
MSRRVNGNVYLFSRGKSDQPDDVEEGAATDDDLEEAGNASTAIAKADLEAISECLQYLYRESNRLDATTTSRLIGAAAIAITQDIEERKG